jgi:IS5 family transposase
MEESLHDVPLFREFAGLDNLNRTGFRGGLLA